MTTSTAVCTFPIVATLTPIGERMNFLPRFVGKASMPTETAIFDTLQSLSADYHHGQWEYFGLSNGGFYMAPKAPKRFQIHRTDNAFSGVMSADAAGILSCLIALNQLAAKTLDACYSRLFHRLRDFAVTHNESRPIMCGLY